MQTRPTTLNCGLMHWLFLYHLKRRELHPNENRQQKQKKKIPISSFTFHQIWFCSVVCMQRHGANPSLRFTLLHFQNCLFGISSCKFLCCFWHLTQLPQMWLNTRSRREIKQALQTLTESTSGICFYDNSTCALSGYVFAYLIFGCFHQCVKNIDASWA